MAAAPNQDDIIAGLLANTTQLVAIDPANVLEADVHAAEADMQTLLESLQGPNGNAILEAFRQHSRFYVTLIEALEYIWRLEAANNVPIEILGRRMMAILDEMFHRNNPQVKQQALIFVQALVDTPNRFQALPHDVDGINLPLSAILIKLLDQFDPLGQANILVPIDGVVVTLREFDLFRDLKDSIVDVIKKLPVVGRFYLNTRFEGDAILARKYCEYVDNTRPQNITNDVRSRWERAVGTIEEIRAATNGFDRRGRY